MRTDEPTSIGRSAPNNALNGTGGLGEKAEAASGSRRDHRLCG